ncbi:P-loop NTPase [Halobaculum sp. CBA1158]|uniref:MinD/ParA family ATP-binding protein n=1 Tax=Halobaculum sp. CBA1158 TaxID=2904243 RepID=UPI001F445092|nr:P-loop NTPase [Halobaculum sp. CBA1158]UIO98860.1 P-loop NTPase [Halobaculum sp. CBA1158]
MLAVTGGKGGTGKTTTTLGVAAALARRGVETVAVDADWDLPDLGALAGVPRRSESIVSIESIGPVDADDPTDAVEPVVDPGVESRSFPGVRVVPAPTDPADRDPGRSLRAVRSSLATGIAGLLDCPAGAGPDAVAPLRVADAALLVTEPCAASLRDAAKAGEMARALDAPVVGAVLTRARFVPPGVADLLGCSVLACVPRADSPVLSAEPVRASYDDAAAALAETPAANVPLEREKPLNPGGS